jgi:DNA-binding transcriptional LysR family regulator
MTLESQLGKLRTLLRLFDNQSFTATGKELRLSQSAVSLHIKELEHQLGITLVNRHERPIRPTEAGRIAVQYAQEIFGRIEELQNRLSEIRDSKAGGMTIGASTSVGSYLLPPTLIRFKGAHPGVELLLRIAPRALVYEDLRMSRCDFAFVLATTAPPNLCFVPLRPERLVFVCSPKHALARAKRVKLDAFHKEMFVTAGEDSDYVSMAKEVLRTYGIANYSVAMELDNMEAVKSAISLNLGIGFLPLLGVRKELRAGELAQIRVEHDQLECVLALVYREKKFFTPAMAEMIQFCRKSFLPKASSSKTGATA